MHYEAYVQSRQYQAQLRYIGGLAMKDLTTIEQIIKNIKDQIKNEESEIKFLTGHYTIQLLTCYLPYEQEMIEKAFEDGVGEGLTDPERPFTGKEYFDIKYKKS